MQGHLIPSGYNVGNLFKYRFPHFLCGNTNYVRGLHVAMHQPPRLRAVQRVKTTQHVTGDAQPIRHAQRRSCAGRKGLLQAALHALIHDERLATALGLRASDGQSDLTRQSCFCSFKG